MAKPHSHHSENLLGTDWELYSQKKKQQAKCLLLQILMGGMFA
jgi:hypothetical protein